MTNERFFAAERKVSRQRQSERTRKSLSEGPAAKIAPRPLLCTYARPRLVGVICFRPSLPALLFCTVLRLPLLRLVLRILLLLGSFFSVSRVFSRSSYLMKLVRTDSGLIDKYFSLLRSSHSFHLISWLLRETDIEWLDFYSSVARPHWHFVPSIFPSIPVDT